VLSTSDQGPLRDLPRGTVRAREAGLIMGTMPTNGPEESPISQGAGPHLVGLDEPECRRRLGSNGIGRVAVTIRALPAILPINYAVLDGDIVFRTGSGGLLEAAVAGAVVAFEVDQTDASTRTGWSVMVVGRARPITDALERSRAANLPLMPWAPGDRDRFIRLETRLLTGRQLVEA
jgi:uncharacterized protein